jgi:hypothetical protein
MPDDVNGWIHVDRGIRRIQLEELSNAKGIPKSWIPTPRKQRASWRSALVLATAIHLWTAVMDSIGCYFRIPCVGISSLPSDLLPVPPSVPRDDGPAARTKWDDDSGN